MDRIKKEYGDGGIIHLTARSGVTKLSATAQRHVDPGTLGASSGQLPRKAEVSWKAIGPVSPRVADDMADLLRAAAQEARS